MTATGYPRYDEFVDLVSAIVPTLNIPTLKKLQSLELAMSGARQEAGTQQNQLAKYVEDYSTPSTPEGPGSPVPVSQAAWEFIQWTLGVIDKPQFIAHAGL